MPAKKRTKIPPVVVVQQSANDEPDETIEERIDREETEEALERATDAASDVGTRVYVRLYRSHPATGNRETLTDSFDAEMFSQDFVRDNYGGGRFRAAFMGPRPGKAGKAGVGLIKQVTFEIDPAIPPKHPKAVSGPVLSGADSSGGMDRMNALVEGGVVALLQSFQSLNAAQVTMMEKMMNRPTMNWGPILTAIAPSLVTLLTAVLNRKDPVDTAREIAQLTVSERKGSAMEEMKDLLSLMTTMREALGTAGGAASSNDDEGEPWLRMFERVGVPLIETALHSNQQQQHAGALPPAPAPAVASPPTPPALSPDTMMQRLIPNLRKWATEGRSAAWAAETILFEVPRGFHPAIAERIKPDTAVAEILAASPDLQPFAPWLAELREELLANILTDEEDSQPSE